MLAQTRKDKAEAHPSVQRVLAKVALQRCHVGRSYLELMQEAASGTQTCDQTVTHLQLNRCVKAPLQKDIVV